jgi:hypothetical protein
MSDGKYGRVSNIEWLEYEQKRFMSLGKLASVHKHPTIRNLYALYVDNSINKYED